MREYTTSFILSSLLIHSSLTCLWCSSLHVMATLSLSHTSSALPSVNASALLGQKLRANPARVNLPRAPSRVGVAVAKYGEKSIYFDLEDIRNTTGDWDLYGSDGPSPYNGLQSKFFETFGGAFTKRGLLLKFLMLGGGGTVAYLSSRAAANLLPIGKGPQETPQPGPRGKT
eukprot:c20461_g1_i2 orf=127-642(+)